MGRPWQGLLAFIDSLNEPWFSFGFPTGSNHLVFRRGRNDGPPMAGALGFIESFNFLAHCLKLFNDDFPGG